MGFLGEIKDKLNPNRFTLVEKSEFNRISQDHYDMLKEFNDSFLMTNGRASVPMPYMDTPDGSKVPLWRLAPNRMYELADYVGDLRAVIETIQREMFRNGIQVSPRYEHKCLNCLKEFKNKPLKDFVPLRSIGDSKKEKLKCDSCGNENPRKWSRPKSENRQVLQIMVDSPINNNGQSLKVVGRQAERDLDIIDGCYVLVTRKWKLKKLEKPDENTGATMRALESIDQSKIDEIIRVHPIQCSIIANDEAVLGVDANNKPRYICPNYEHRITTLTEPVCPKCGAECFNAFLETNSVPFAVPLASPKKMYYTRKEVVWIPGKYYPDTLYGNTPIQAIWKKVLSLMFQDEYMWKYFDKDRPPKSLLAIGSRNPESVQAFMERQKQGARQDPYMPRPLLLNTENAKAGIEYIDLTPNFKELELTELRKELRQIISTVYGVQPLFYGEQAKAGLGNEALQVTLTNRTIKWFQRFFNENFFDYITKEIMGIYDWKIELVTSEEIDELRDEQIRGQKIDNVTKLYQMGFDVALDGENELVTSQFPNPEKQEMMMGGGKGLGQGANSGDPKKAKTSKASDEKSTNFEGEPKLNRPSDVGGADNGSPTSGSSLSLKTVDPYQSFTKPIRGHSWEYWDEKLKDEYPDEKTRGAVIGSMEKIDQMIKDEQWTNDNEKVSDDSKPQNKDKKPAGTVRKSKKYKVKKNDDGTTDVEVEE